MDAPVDKEVCVSAFVCLCKREPTSMFVNLEKGLVKAWEMVTLTGAG